jgi:hypothetical protein
MNQEKLEEIEYFVIDWVMHRGRGYGVAGIVARRVSPGQYEASIEVSRSLDTARTVRRMFVADGATKTQARRACIATALRAMAYEVDP